MSIPYSLAELEAEFVRYGADGGIHHPVDLANAQGVMFLCPKCFGANGGNVGTHRVLSWFRGKGVPDDAKPGPGRWEVEGFGLNDLTLRPSIDLSTSGGCDWHGFVTNGSAK
jgi:hypothetical protein